MDLNKNAERVLSGLNGFDLNTLKRLRCGYRSLPESSSRMGKVILNDITGRIDVMEPNSLEARWRRLFRKS